MRLSHSIKGLVLGPVFAALIIFLGLTCPAGRGQGCFADFFISILFLPLPFIYKVFSNHPDIVGRHEVVFLLIYWSLVGFFIGLLVDVHKKKTH